MGASEESLQACQLPWTAKFAVHREVIVNGQKKKVMVSRILQAVRNRRIALGISDGEHDVDELLMDIAGWVQVCQKLFHSSLSMPSYSVRDVEARLADGIHRKSMRQLEDTMCRLECWCLYILNDDHPFKKVSSELSAQPVRVIRLLVYALFAPVEFPLT
jgi:hypothetical protein